MDGYGINIGNIRGEARYRAGGDDSWDLAEAAEKALELLDGRTPRYVSVGNDEHEFRIYSNPDDAGRWADWFVDAEVAGRRWIYRPLADLGEYGDADGLAEEAAALYPDVTKIWVGRSDGSEEYESDVDAG